MDFLPPALRVMATCSNHSGGLQQALGILTPLCLSFLVSQEMTKVSVWGGYLYANTRAPPLRGNQGGGVLPPGWSLSRGSMGAGLLTLTRVLPEKNCSPLTAGLFLHYRPGSSTGQNGPHTGRISTSLTPCLLEAHYNLFTSRRAFGPLLLLCFPLAVAAV